eukprot:TRINITY_DN11863_c0_g1_i1.p1 TRINITY_DN11863_c0_g1~~TRINITY_DN11863_c0_g1_i1.p1  ORF type:complete len:497 (-),score=138.81 TRINITY_DN11863_c0_g1_i1:27-1517(-)
MFFVIVSTRSLKRERKARLRNTEQTYNRILMASPITLLVVAIGTALGAPLLPIFGLPVFVVGFPRPLRHWPSISRGFASGQDASFYIHLLPQMLPELMSQLKKGAMGDAQPGMSVLLRHQSRILWVQVLERGFTTFTVLVKGLELQETSCHAVEATRIDDVLQHGMEVSQSGQQGADQRANNNDFNSSTNQFYWSILHPVSHMNVNTYSRSTLSLTGVIDYPDNLEAIPGAFQKTLAFLFHKNKSAMAQSIASAVADQPELYEFDSIRQSMPVEWIEYLGESKDSDVLHLTAICFALTHHQPFPMGFNATGAGPKHVFNCISGRFPPAMESTAFFNTHPGVRAMVVQAYRYAFKVVMDSMLYGEFEDDDELKQQLEEYEQDWFVGLDDGDWHKNVAKQTPNMLQLRENTAANGGSVSYSAESLTMSTQTMLIGKLNYEAVRAQWSSMNLELYYLVNDDDERYSIQANPSLLRNISIEAAQPPLGYPLLSTGAVAVE